MLGLASGQILVWSASYYFFPALLLRWERELGWSYATPGPGGDYRPAGYVPGDD